MPRMRAGAAILTLLWAAILYDSYEKSKESAYRQGCQAGKAPR